MMIRIAVIAAVLAFLVAAARQSAKYHCGTPLVDAVMILVFLALGYPVVRAMVHAYSWTAPPPRESRSRSCPIRHPT
jgi:hypothetical protein